MRLRRLLVALALPALLATGCSSAGNVERDFAESPNLVSIRSGSGNVSVTAVDSGASIAAEISASGEDPPWTADLEGGELVIDDGCGERSDCRVNLVIEVAGTADLAVESADGAVSIVDMNSSLTINGTAGSVLLNGITGPITVDLVGGDVLGARLVSTEASFTTGDGDIDVTFTEALDRLEISSGSGDVTAQVPDVGYDIDATASAGSVDINVAEVEGAPASIVIHTDEGDVTIYRR